MTPRFLVIGNPIAQSKSPDIHAIFAAQTGIDIRYHKLYCPDDAASFEAAITGFFYGGGTGANVTVPFKQIAHDYCAARGGLSDHARIAGAVNTLLLKDGAVCGDNTDGQGLVQHMAQLGWQLDGARVAIIGAGGAARGTVLPLIEAGIHSLTLANRTESKAADLIEDLATADARIQKMDITSCAIGALTGDFDVIINATSIGLSGAALALDSDLTTRAAYDMMYGRDLPFLTHFAARGAVTSDGFGMLIGQAALSFERWTGHAPDTRAAMTSLMSTK